VPVGGDVAGCRQFVLGGAVYVVEHPLRQPAAGDPAEIADVGGSGQPALNRVNLEAPKPEDRSK
ncbi:MAG TPA: hypothetical protein VIT93_01515, partial [Dehalococcoidia bacterium]